MLWCSSSRRPAGEELESGVDEGIGVQHICLDCFESSRGGEDEFSGSSSSADRRYDGWAQRRAEVESRRAANLNLVRGGMSGNLQTFLAKQGDEVVKTTYKHRENIGISRTVRAFISGRWTVDERAECCADAARGGPRHESWHAAAASS